jgi:micrococcal nuclease
VVLLAACSLVPSTTGETAGADSGETAAVEETAADSGFDLAADDERVRALTDLPQGENPCADPLLVRVQYTVDGDTFYAEREDDGEQVKVRMIGVNTPEVAHDDPAQCYANEAWTYTAQALESRLAWLTFDGDCLDDYDRSLAYVFRDATEDGFFNRNLARYGYAYELAIAPNESFAEEIGYDVLAAQQEDRGLWGACY